MKPLQIKLACRHFVINEPVFGTLKVLIPAFNRLQIGTQSDKATILDVRLILALLLGPQIKKLHWFRRPSVAEIANLLQKLPDFLQLEAIVSKPEAPALSGAEAWDQLYCIIIDRTGWTFEQIDTTMTLSRLAAMNEYWQKHPPTNNLVAAYLGYEHEPEDAGLSALIRQLKQANNDE